MTKSEMLRCRVEPKLKEKFEEKVKEYNRKNHLDITSSDYLRMLIVKDVEKQRSSPCLAN